MYFFVHVQGIKTVHARRGGGRKWQISVHVVVECPHMYLTAHHIWSVTPFYILLGHLDLVKFFSFVNYSTGLLLATLH